MSGGSHIKWFKDLGMADVPLVGGKNASLGEMVRELSAGGVRVPDGFAVTAPAYRYFLTANGLDRKLADLKAGLDVADVDNLRRTGRAIRDALLGATLPADLEAAILEAYRRLGGEDVAVRSSATAEDLPDASFAGQQDTFLNVRGEAMLLHTVRQCFASLYTDRAISYRADKGYAAADVALSVGVQRMVRSDLACSGVMFSIDTETGFRDAVLISAAYGLGENVVQGAVNPDEYYVFKPTLATGSRPILRRKIGEKAIRMVYDESGGKMTRNVPVPESDRRRAALTDDEVLALARWAVVIEDHYSRRRGQPTPMDMEWAKDGRTGELFIVQARPETVHSQALGREAGFLEVHRLKGAGETVITGRSVGNRIGKGRARVIRHTGELHLLQKGEVLVADRTDPDWEPAMKLAAAIVTNRGGRTCHAAIVSRELRLPAVVGCGEATERIRTGDEVTVDCSQGDTGVVYRGLLAVEVERIPLDDLRPSRVRIMMNVADPDEAMRLSFIPNDGVGLARLEFIINNSIGVHPMALVRYAGLPEGEAKRRIGELTAGYPDKTAFFVDRLAEGVATIAAAFYPKDVIVRMSDFKTNEYAHLLGGEGFEPREENPMIGFRGASRYYDDRYREGFALECRAMRRVREDMGLTNVKLMIPFCRTVEEGVRVLDEMARHGLKRGERGLEVYVMCEIPSNVILAAEFARVFDGFSIGSNDLTQLVLGCDRDSELIAHLFDERNPAVKAMIAQVIRAARAAGRKIGICGQAPSDYPEFAEFLVGEGIDSISLNPDSVVATSRRLARLAGA